MFLLAWLAEEFIHRKKFIILELFRSEDLVEESTGEGGLRRIRAELMQGCASATNFRPAAVVISRI